MYFKLLNIRSKKKQVKIKSKIKYERKIFKILINNLFIRFL